MNLHLISQAHRSELPRTFFLIQGSCCQGSDDGDRPRGATRAGRVVAGLSRGPLWRMRVNANGLEEVRNGRKACLSRASCVGTWARAPWCPFWIRADERLTAKSAICTYQPGVNSMVFRVIIQKYNSGCNPRIQLLKLLAPSHCGWFSSIWFICRDSFACLVIVLWRVGQTLIGRRHGNCCTPYETEIATAKLQADLAARPAASNTDFAERAIRSAKSALR